MKAYLFDSLIFAYLFTLLVIAFGPGTEEFVKANITNGSLMFFAFAVLSSNLSKLLNAKQIQTLGGKLFFSESKKQNIETQSWYKSFWGIQLALVFIATLITGYIVTDIDLREVLSADGFAGAKRIFAALASPNFGIFKEGLLAIFETIYIAFMATVIAIPFAFLLSFLCAKNIMGSSKVGFGIYVLLRTYLNVTRSIEPLIWAIIFSVWVGIGPFAGMLALMLHSISSLAKQYSEIIECISEGPIEGIKATGANSLQVIWFAVVPQIILPYISFTIYRWDINVRMATIIGLVGGGGIGTMLIMYQGQAMWNEVGTLALLIVAAVWLMDTASAYIREAIK